MKRIKLMAVALILLGLTSTAWVGVASAHSFHTGSNVTLNSKESVQQTVFAAGQTVDINNEVFGDVFCAGQTVTVSGIVHGDVICAGQTVNVSGTVDGDVRLAGQTVTLNAAVAGNATVAGQNFTLTSAGKVGGDMTIGSTSAVLDGAIGRDLALGGNTAVIANTVGRDIKGAVNILTLSANAKVGGNIEYTSNNVIEKSASATVAGTVTRHTPSQHKAKPKHGAIWGFGLMWLLYWLAAMLLIAMAVVLLFPRLLQAVTNRGMTWPWKALLVGFLANAAMPLALFLLAITVVGIPLALLLFVLWLAMAALSAPVFAYYAGRWILQGSRNALLIMLVGAGVVTIAMFIPIIGFIVSLASFLIGSGMLLLEVFERTPKPNYRVNSGTSK